MLLQILLQINPDTTVQAAQDMVQAESAASQLSLWYLMKEGGPLMIPLLICSIVAIAIFVERLLAIKKATNVPVNYMHTVKENVLDGNVSKALSYSQSFDTAIPNMITKGIKRIGRPVENIEKSMENEGKIEVYKMEKNLGVLSAIAEIAPMMGFLGTIIGMLILFFDIQQRGFELQSLAGGIYTKMVTSAVGLIIGLLSYIAYNFLNSQINKHVNKMEIASNDFLDLLNAPNYKK